MESNSDIEIEPYEEVVEHFSCLTPHNSKSCSPVTVAVASTVQSAFYEPIEKTGRVENVDSQSTELFAPAPRPTLRQELAAGRNQERTAVVNDRGGSATLAPNVGLRMSGQNVDVRKPTMTVDRDSCRVSAVETEHDDRMIGLFDEFSDARDRPLTEPLTVRTDSVVCSRDRDRPPSAPVSWMAGITARVNSLWKLFHGRPTFPISTDEHVRRRLC